MLRSGCSSATCTASHSRFPGPCSPRRRFLASLVARKCVRVSVGVVWSFCVFLIVCLRSRRRGSHSYILRTNLSSTPPPFCFCCTLQPDDVHLAENFVDTVAKKLESDRKSYYISFLTGVSVYVCSSLFKHVSWVLVFVREREHAYVCS